MNGIIKRIGGWLAAVVTTVVLGVFLQTQNVLARLENIGADIGFIERISMSLYDLRYLGSLYVIFVSIALAIAFLVGGLAHYLTEYYLDKAERKPIKYGRQLAFSAAGAVALLVMLFGMKQAFFDIHMIAGARDALGISLQMLAGAIGGFVFAWVSRPKEKAPAENAEA